MAKLARGPLRHRCTGRTFFEWSVDDAPAPVFAMALSGATRDPDPLDTPPSEPEPTTVPEPRPRDVPEPTPA